jgi:hypothetical protein
MSSPATQSNTNPWMPVLNKAQWPTASNVIPSVKGTQEPAVEWSTSWVPTSNVNSVPKQTKVVRYLFEQIQFFSFRYFN